MNSFTTTIYINDVEYEANVVGNHDKGQKGTREDPEIKPSFEVTEIWINTKTTLGRINLKTPEYDWLIWDELDSMLEADFFTLLKADYYDPNQFKTTDA